MSENDIKAAGCELALTAYVRDDNFSWDNNLTKDMDSKADERDIIAPTPISAEVDNLIKESEMTSKDPMFWERELTSGVPNNALLASHNFRAKNIRHETVRSDT